MAFLDNLSKKISNAGQTAMQKTKDITDIAKINNAISEEEKKINNNYYQIGKAYVSLHAADSEPQLAGLVAAIKDSEQKISNYRQQIQDIKGIVRCENCGSEVSINVAFCSSCGVAMPKHNPANHDMIKCNCGQLVPFGTKFCTYCGSPIGPTHQPAQYQQPAPFQEPVMTQEPAPFQEPILTQEPAPFQEPVLTQEPAPFQEPIMTQEPVYDQPMPADNFAPEEDHPTAPYQNSAPVICSNCGTVAAPGSLFCIGCGTKL